MTRPPGAFRTGTTTAAGLLLLLALAWSAVGQPVKSFVQTLEALAADSEIVVRGTIVSVENSNKPPTLDRWNTVTFSVEESLKGHPPKTLQFVIPQVSFPDLEQSNWIASKAG